MAESSSNEREVLLVIDGVRKKFCRSLRRSLWYGMRDMAAEVWGGPVGQHLLRANEFWAIDGVSLTLRRGECLGLIGSNGAGKTTLLKLLTGLIKPDAGRITLRGRVAGLIGLGSGFNPLLTGRENVYINGSVLGLTTREIDDAMDEIIAFADLAGFIDTPVQNYSSGMHVRLAYAVAARLRPDVLLVDEVLAVGDVGFQRKCMQSMFQYVANGGSVVLVSHNMHAVQSICTTVAVFERGRLVFHGPVNEGVKVYYSLHHATSETEHLKDQQSSSRSDEPVVIRDVEIMSPDGGAILTGGPMRIALHYEAHAPVDRVAWGFSLWTEDQQLRICTATSSWDSQLVALAEGNGCLECVIPRTPFLANSYFLKAGIYDASTSWPIARIGWDNSPIRFVVESPASEAYNRQIISGDVIALDVTWRH